MVATLAGVLCVVPFITSALADDIKMSPEATIVPYDDSAFGPDPSYEDKPYDPQAQLDIYGAKFAVDTPRPLLELGRELYGSGPFSQVSTVLGELNPVFTELYVYGDWRNVVAYNDNGALEVGKVATQLNLDIDYRFTATERIHAFVQPLNQGGNFTNCEFFGDDEDDCDLVLDLNADALFFEGDIGALMAGFTGEYSSFDLPFAVGLMPLLFQNGIWVEDAFTGVAFAIPALHSGWLDISNYDVSFFAGFDKVSTAAVLDNDGVVADHNVNLYGVTAFVEAMNGYFEFGYGYTDAEDGLDDQDYHNLAGAFTSRYGSWLSNSMRAVWSVGQSRDDNVQQTADGVIFLVENSLVTHLPSTLIPYANFFAGFDRPQSLARAAAAGGILKNTGINFETDGQTGFPKLDDTGRNTFGGALGVEYLFELNRQIVVEAATVQVIEGRNEPGRPANGDEYALGLRYQYPLDVAWIFRFDAMHGWRVEEENLAGARVEIRRKF
jgi:hypothetical protein